jgi:hypothetical protein
MTMNRHYASRRRVRVAPQLLILLSHPTNGVSLAFEALLQLHHLSPTAIPLLLALPHLLVLITLVGEPLDLTLDAGYLLKLLSHRDDEAFRACATGKIIALTGNHVDFDQIHNFPSKVVEGLGSPDLASLGSLLATRHVVDECAEELSDDLTNDFVEDQDCS